jgi:hypothetical protein
MRRRELLILPGRSGQNDGYGSGNEAKGASQNALPRSLAGAEVVMAATGDGRCTGG